MPIDHTNFGPDCARVDILFEDLDHAGASYEGRVFVNNPKANHKTDLSEAARYAGSFHIFGHGGCFGDVGHCEINAPRSPYDTRAAHPLTPMMRKVVATDALRNEALKGKPITITVVPIVKSGTARSDLHTVFHCSRIRVVTYDK